MRRQECVLDLSSKGEEAEQSVKDASFYLCRCANQRRAHAHTHTYTHRGHGTDKEGRREGSWGVKEETMARFLGRMFKLALSLRGHSYNFH